jgi:hypothetical protein
MKIEDFVHRKGELSHMSRCTSDAAVYKPTLKIFLHRRSSGCSVVRCAGSSTAMEFRYVLLRVHIRKPRPYSEASEPYTEDGGPYSEDCGPYPADCQPYTEAVRRISEFRKSAGRNRNFRKSAGRKRNSGSPRAENGTSESLGI